MRRGSITVFMSLSMMLVMSLFFTLAEGVHQKLLSNEKILLAVRTTENMEAMYNKILWEQFHILGVDAGFGKDDGTVVRFQNKAEGYLLDAIRTEGIDFSRFQDVTLEVSNYAFLTDQDAAGFVQEAANQVKYLVTESLVEEWTSQYQQIASDSETTDSVDDLIEEGQQASEELKNSSETSSAKEASSVKGTSSEAGIVGVSAGKRCGFLLTESTKEENTEDSNEQETESNKYEGKENPLEVIDSLMEDGILSIALPEGFEVSDQALTVESGERVSGRTLNTGNATDVSDASVAEQILLEQYLIETFQSAIVDQGRECLKYEMEYILCGKDSDRANLESTLLRILALREVENLIAIHSDAKKIAEADSYALAITTATATPILYEAVKYGIIAVWALIESVLDLRTLLCGGRIAIVKTPVEWTSELLNFSSYLGAGKKAKESEIGLAYNDYLRILMLFESKSNLAYRAMDICEIEIRGVEHYENFRMDHVLVKADMKYSFDASPIFFTFVPQLQGKYDGYRMEAENVFSYL